MTLHTNTCPTGAFFYLYASVNNLGAASVAPLFHVPIADICKLMTINAVLCTGCLCGFWSALSDCALTTMSRDRYLKEGSTAGVFALAALFPLHVGWLTPSNTAAGHYSGVSA